MQINNLEQIIYIVIGIIILWTSLHAYLQWLFIKSAISRGVEQGVYNAIVELQNNNVIKDIHREFHFQGNIINSQMNNKNP